MSESIGTRIVKAEHAKILPPRTAKWSPSDDRIAKAIDEAIDRAILKAHADATIAVQDALAPRVEEMKRLKRERDEAQAIAIEARNEKAIAILARDEARDLVRRMKGTGEWPYAAAAIARWDSQ